MLLAFTGCTHISLKYTLSLGISPYFRAALFSRRILYSIRAEGHFDAFSLQDIKVDVAPKYQYGGFISSR